MREILFRGQTRRYGEKVRMGDGEKLPSRWVYGGVLQGTGDFSIIYGGENPDAPSDGLDKCAVYTDTLGQYTGLTDKNGKRIFEGDILKYHDPFVMKATGVVCFGENQWSGNSNVGFYMKWVIADLPDILRTDLGFWCNEREVEVIGNIHDNPELLKEAEP